MDGRFLLFSVAVSVQAAAWSSSAWADTGSTAIETLVKRGLALALWIAIGVFGVLGIVVFCNGVMKMWDTDDPKAQKQGKRMMFWGGFLTVAVLFAVAVRDYLTSGLSLTPADLNPFLSQGAGG
jgi:succinate dehydrogenase/fumarate reductase cytochrome b subunit